MYDEPNFHERCCVSDSVKRGTKKSGEVETLGSAKTHIHDKTDPSDPMIGRVLGGTYRLLERRGKGGMGVVFRAEHIRLKRTFAVKVLRPDISSEQDYVDRFCREARAASAIRHDAIVDVVDINCEEDGTWYIVMEFLEGEDLQLLLQRGDRLPLETALTVTSQMCSALFAAHSRGIVHRDIKPGNIFLPTSDGEGVRAKLLDFGVSKLMEAGAGITGTGLIIGTPLYMSPEQACGDPSLDHRADIFSMGVVLYEMLTGTTPFAATAPMAVIARIMTEDAVPPSTVNPDVPDWLDRVILKCLDRNPRARFSTAGELMAALEQEGGYIQEQTPRSSMGPSEAAGELRVVTVAFVSFSATSQMGRNLSPDESNELLESVFSEAKEIIADHGGTIPRYFGDGFMALFGAPVAHGDDAVRALRAMISLEKLAGDSEAGDLGIKISAGVTTGRVVAGRLRGFGESGYGVVGNAVGLARRMEGLGPTGSILACKETYLHVRGRFRVKAITFSSGPGNETEEIVYSVLEENPHGLVVAPREILGSKVRMAGRVAEVAQLLGAFERAVDERTSQMVTVIGAPGMGKSRLAYELLGHVEDMEGDVLIITAAGHQLAEGSPLTIWASAIREKAGINVDEDASAAGLKLERFVQYLWTGVTGDSSRIVRDLLALLGLGESHDTSRPLLDNLEDSLFGLLEPLLEKFPAVIMFDDVQWVDSASLELLRRVVDRLSERRLFVLLLARPEFVVNAPEYLFEGTERQRIDLKPLTRRESRELLRNVLGPGVPEDLLEKIAERSGGTPLFIEEILHDLVEREVVTRAGQKWLVSRDVDTLDIPLTVEAVIQARLDQLPTGERDVLVKASVVGEQFWDGSLAAMGVGQVDSGLARLVSKELLRLQPTSCLDGCREYVFRHGLIRDVAYGLTPAKERRQLHQAVAAWIVEYGAGNVEAHAMIARHLQAAEDYEGAVDNYVISAGLVYGVELQKSDGRFFGPSFMSKMAGKISDQLTADEVEKIMTMACDLANDHLNASRAMDVSAASASMFANVGDMIRSGRFWKRVVRLAESLEDLDMLLLAMVEEAKTLCNTRQSEEAFEMLRRAEPLYGDERSFLSRSRYHRANAQIYYVRGEMDDAIKCGNEALLLAREGNLQEDIAANAHNIGDEYLKKGQLEKAREYLEESQELAVALGCGIVVKINEQFLLTLDALQKADNTAIEKLEEKVRAARSEGIIWDLLQLNYNLGYIYAERGDIEHARKHLTECIEHGKTTGNRVYERKATKLLEKLTG
jgi:eukaryotic-like serine/threonine-protein kinase